MFTGIVIESGQIRACEPSDGGVDLQVEAPEIAAGVRIGDSVAVDGCCLTVARHDGAGARVQRGRRDPAPHHAGRRWRRAIG